MVSRPSFLNSTRIAGEHPKRKIVMKLTVRARKRLRSNCIFIVEDTWLLDSIVGLVNTSGLKAGFIPAPGRFRETIRAEALHVGRWRRIEQRLDQELSDAAGAGDAVRVAAARHDEARHTAALADDEASIWCEGRPAFADRLF